MKKAIHALLFFACLGVAVVPASADTLLNTFISPGYGTDTSFGGWSLSGSLPQSLALPFSTSNAVTVDSILAAIFGDGGMTFRQFPLQRGH
jgi:hypothetical protein